MGTRIVQRKTEIAAAIVTVLAGCVFLLPPDAPNAIVRLSFDLLQLVLPPYAHPDPVIVYIDGQAMQDYSVKPGGTFPRRFHARLLDRLTRDQAQAVIFDVAMTEPGESSEDLELANAIHRNGRVVLAGTMERARGVEFGHTKTPPLELFETNAAGWGTTTILLDPDGGGRRYGNGDVETPGLVWAAASLVNAEVTKHPERRLKERWLNYYGSGQPFAKLSLTYTNAESCDTNCFRGKTVIIGGKPATLDRGDTTDIFPTPFTRWNNLATPGVEITAIAYANLVHNECLYRFGFWTEVSLFLVIGAACGLGFQRMERRTAIWVALCVAVFVIAATVTLLLKSQLWFAWLIVVLIQLPCALVFRMVTQYSPVPILPITNMDEKPTTQEAQVADHTLVRCVGEGAYGQVWIGRNAIGLHHAVKIIYRNRFSVEGPYDRALRGIQKFMPISRSHEGFVHILHVGKNDAAGYFYYIMEAGDDEKTGQNIDPTIYSPKTLASELRARKSIPPAECLELMLSLTEAADRLHQHQLIHRDIKPANIIFVNNRPKLADIDLVTDIAATGEVSRIGTEGYLAPEGPGTASADVFSLGRILYVSLTGKRPDLCPELPTDITQRPDCDLFLKLTQIACKACESELTRRYSSALLMRTDLLHVASQVASTTSGDPKP